MQDNKSVLTSIMAFKIALRSLPAIVVVENLLSFARVGHKSITIVLTNWGVTVLMFPTNLASGRMTWVISGPISYISHIKQWFKL